ncbi:hypothetical protein [Sorangium sp. So ce861]|uniref:hypothetical protein n=1 Tax=Sorangium sp. So ce861 TaxID=3133323 RepID=UPI003F5EECCF
MSTNTDGIDELEHRAALLRANVRASLDELERMNEEQATTASGAAGPAVRDKEAKDSPERERLEQRADVVREHLVSRVGEMERRARAKVVPLAAIGGAVLVALTLGLGYMFYKTLRR